MRFICVRGTRNRGLWAMLGQALHARAYRRTAGRDGIDLHLRSQLYACLCIGVGIQV